MYPLVKSLHPIKSWLAARALNWCDMAPISENGLSPLIRMNLGIEYKNFRVSSVVLRHPLCQLVDSLR